MGKHLDDSAGKWGNLVDGGLVQLGNQFKDRSVFFKADFQWQVVQQDWHDNVQWGAFRGLQGQSGNTATGIGVGSVDHVSGVFVVLVNGGFLLLNLGQELGESVEDVGVDGGEVLHGVEDHDTDTVSGVGLDLERLVVLQSFNEQL
ncbi:hypothetical protein WICPIJ_006656 [Wickerhamomyces pijperi]|uniref:Uncharacterized protein n=1 Tax=Wickerhamomyces pijperi TaxID=599730 RepID=A0A9P8Q3D5_WICPI|nr:hypothetical protein WICPIJ_006656 [Wickerhamomyces pijperi]